MITRKLPVRYFAASSQSAYEPPKPCTSTSGGPPCLPPSTYTQRVSPTCTDSWCKPSRQVCHAIAPRSSHCGAMKYTPKPSTASAITTPPRIFRRRASRASSASRAGLFDMRRSALAGLRRGLLLRRARLREQPLHRHLRQRVVTILRFRVHLLGVREAFRRLHEGLVHRHGQVQAADARHVFGGGRP